jgi:hypothetical protein
MRQRRRLLVLEPAQDIRDSAETPAGQIVHQMETEQTVRINQESPAPGQGLVLDEAVRAMKAAQGIDQKGRPQGAEPVEPWPLHCTIFRRNGKKLGSVVGKRRGLAIYDGRLDQAQPRQAAQDHPAAAQSGGIQIRQRSVP